ncbi:MAG: sugar ABC transporter permease [Clostridium sp.]|nr:sugar ABC transporter permease [Clostridium sp.]
MRLKRKTKESLTGYSFISLWIIGFLVFTLIPIGRTAFLSFNKVKVTTEGIKTTFVGIQNYKDALLMDVQFVDTLITYLGEIIVYVPIILVFSLAMAMLLNMDIKFKGLFRTIFFLPVIITSGPVIQKLIEKGATSIPSITKVVESGIITQAVPGVLGDIITTILSSLIVILWFAGVPIIIFIAGLQKIDRAVYEAASIDGASKWESFWKITLPALNPMVILNVVYTIVTISMFSVNGVIMHIQTKSFDDKWGLGYASAMSWIYFAVLLVILGIFVLLVKPKSSKKVEKI